MTITLPPSTSSSAFGHACGDIEQVWRLVQERMKEALIPARSKNDADHDEKHSAVGPHSSDDDKGDMDLEEDIDEEENMDVKEE